MLADAATPPVTVPVRTRYAGYDDPVPYKVLAPTTAPRLTMAVADAAAVLGIPRSSAYAAVARGTLPCIRFGRHIVVPRASVDRLLDESRQVPDKP